MTQSLIEPQKIDALFGDKQLTQISPWINLLLSSQGSASRLRRSGPKGRFGQAPFLPFKADISLIDNLHGGGKKMAAARLKLAPRTVITIYVLFSKGSRLKRNSRRLRMDTKHVAEASDSGEKHFHFGGRAIHTGLDKHERRLIDSK